MLFTQQQQEAAPAKRQNHPAGVSAPAKSKSTAGAGMSDSQLEVIEVALNILEDVLRALRAGENLVPVILNGMATLFQQRL